MTASLQTGSFPYRAIRIRKHGDYVAVYDSSRRHTSPTLSYFYRSPVRLGNAEAAPPARFGITTPRALGDAVLRNRIKRRLRVAARAALPLLPAGTEVVLHPRALAAVIAFPLLEAELQSVFARVAHRISAGADNTPQPRRPRGRR